MNKRLEAIKNLVEPGSVVADIGTDHAFVPIACIKEGLSPKCYACDVIDGPCQIAKTNIEEEGLSSQIEVIKSNGFEHVPLDIDCAIIAGMGFGTAREILEDGMEHLYKCKQIIVQVNKDIIDLRRWISNHHFTITAEKLVYDDRFYQIVVFNTNYHSEYSDLHVTFGPFLMKERSELFIDYLKDSLNTYKMIEEVLPKTDARYPELSQKIQIFTALLNKPSEL
ncbi:tRNA (adenine(22)-N(1))-methyltransferase [Anaerorhabdus furcosa]|uniref:tRNA (Adenine22-N1)-methyltransferase n=1 Tax=Anaerorhabdus furcosa TaxID=118967 RepID=A0A1T4N5W1_9FIRM|nr:class I SAM-dependent methyltransferase [Anaerorhabdus furcosa]SJZ74593.1 tRNA (adenine22-N1)-methyltransferase [Anaerorhabdus furcosa]